MEGGGWLWPIDDVIGRVVFAVALIYGMAMWRKRPMSPAAEGARNEAETKKQGQEQATILKAFDKETPTMSEGKGIRRALNPLPNIVHAEYKEPLFKAGDNVKIAMRFPIGHYRVPNYIRGKLGRVEAVIEPRAVNNEEEGFGRNVGLKRHYYRVGIPLTELWPNYTGSPNDGLRIEVFEDWLEKR